jgi:ribosomal protein S14
MLFSKIKDQFLRAAYNKIEHKKKIYKYIQINLIHKFFYKKKKSKKIKKLKLYFYKAIYSRKKKFFRFSNVKIIRRCLINNRSKSVYKNFGLSRNIFRELIQFGVIPGFRKAVW